MSRYKFAFFVVVGTSKVGFRANAEETTERFDVRKNFDIWKPPVTKKDDMVFFPRKEVVAKRNAFFYKIHFIGLRIVFAFETAEP